MLKDLTLDEVRTMAVRARLPCLTDEHLQQLLRATHAARQRRAALPTANLTPADEPVQVFRLYPDIDVAITASALDPACRIDDPAEIGRTYGRQARAPFNQ